MLPIMKISGFHILGFLLLTSYFLHCPSVVCHKFEVSNYLLSNNDHNPAKISIQSSVRIQNAEIHNVRVCVSIYIYNPFLSGWGCSIHKALPHKENNDPKWTVPWANFVRPQGWYNYSWCVWQSQLKHNITFVHKYLSLLSSCVYIDLSGQCKRLPCISFGIF